MIETRIRNEHQLNAKANGKRKIKLIVIQDEFCAYDWYEYNFLGMYFHIFLFIYFLFLFCFNLILNVVVWFHQTNEILWIYFIQAHACASNVIIAYDEIYVQINTSIT